LEAVAIQVRRSALSLRNDASGDDSNLDSGSLAVGAQNCSDQAEGAYTGEVSAAMLAEVGAEYVIVGHSERRQLYGESSEQVAARYAQVLDAGLRPILCVGETLDERAASKTLDVIGEQVDAVLTRCGKAGLRVKQLPLSRLRRFIGGCVSAWLESMLRSEKVCEFFMAAVSNLTMLQSFLLKQI